MKDVILKAQNLTKNYETGEAGVAAIQNLDLEIFQGEYTVIMGSSGSGKSTLLFLLTGLDKASSGTVVLEGQDIQSLNETKLALLRRRGFGFVFQAMNLVSNLSLLENILAAGYLGSSDRTEVRNRARELMALMDLTGLENRLPSQVSGGQQQRAAMARALINQPRILFADEPTGALNHSSGQVLLDCLDQISREGQTIVMVTHDLKSASRGQRIVFLRDGQVGGEFRFRDQGLEGASPADREQKLFTWLSGMGW